MNQATSESSHPIDATQLPALERWKRAFTALAAVLRDPENTEQVLVFSTYANAGSMPERIHFFHDHPTGKKLYQEYRTIDAHAVDLDALATLPVGTLGRAYSDFLTSRGLTPDIFENPPEDITSPEMAYVVLRLRQTHDLWHVVTGYNTDPASEVALQAFTFGQLRAPSSGILALLGTLHGSQLKRDLFRDVFRAYRVGARCQRLAVFPWEDHWSTPLSEVRTMLGLPVEPRDPVELSNAVQAVIAQVVAQPSTAPMPKWIVAAVATLPRAA